MSGGAWVPSTYDHASALTNAAKGEEAITQMSNAALVL